MWTPQVDINFPGIEKFDRLPEPRTEGAKCVCFNHGRLLQILLVLHGALYPWHQSHRPFEDVLVECIQLATQGVREINLLGQNVNAYQGVYGEGEYADLGLLIRTIAEIDGIGRIRFTTSHPLEFSDTLIEAYRDVPKLANYLHLPVQSAATGF